MRADNGRSEAQSPRPIKERGAFGEHSWHSSAPLHPVVRRLAAIRDRCQQTFVVSCQVASKDRLMVSDPIAQEADVVEASVQILASPAIVRKGAADTCSPEAILVVIARGKKRHPEAKGQLGDYGIGGRWRADPQKATACFGYSHRRRFDQMSAWVVPPSLLPDESGHGLMQQVPNQYLDCDDRSPQCPRHLDVPGVKAHCLLGITVAGLKVGGESIRRQSLTDDGGIVTVHRSPYAHRDGRAWCKIVRVSPGAPLIQAPGAQQFPKPARPVDSPPSSGFRCGCGSMRP